MNFKYKLQVCHKTNIIAVNSIKARTHPRDNNSNNNGVPVAQWLEHCVSSAKGCGFDSQGTHILMKMYNLNAIVSRFG